jgi:hypothetical protein
VRTNGACPRRRPAHGGESDVWERNGTGEGRGAALRIGGECEVRIAVCGCCSRSLVFDSGRVCEMTRVRRHYRAVLLSFFLDARARVWCVCVRRESTRAALTLYLLVGDVAVALFGIEVEREVVGPRRVDLLPLLGRHAVPVARVVVHHVPPRLVEERVLPDRRPRSSPAAAQAVPSIGRRPPTTSRRRPRPQFATREWGATRGGFACGDGVRTVQTGVETRKSGSIRDSPWALLFRKRPLPRRPLSRRHRRIAGP